MGVYNQIKEKEEILNKLLFENDGEITPEFELIENALNDDREGLVEYLCKQIKNDESDATGLKEEELRINKQRKYLENKIIKRKDFIRFLTKGQKGQYGSFKIGYIFRQASKLVINNEDLILKKYYKTTSKINNESIKQALKDGKKVKGAELVDTNNLQIS